MTKQKFNKKNLIDILIKKASGFYYEEEIFEYEKTQKQINSTLNSNIKCENMSFFDNNDRVSTIHASSSDTIKLTKDNEQNKHENLTLSKKKITTHYIPPDLHSIKILLEIFSQEEVENSVENLTDEQLINLRNKLIKEIKIED